MSKHHDSRTLQAHNTLDTSTMCTVYCHIADSSHQLQGHLQAGSEELGPTPALMYWQTGRQQVRLLHSASRKSGAYRMLAQESMQSAR